QPQEEVRPVTPDDSTLEDQRLLLLVDAKYKGKAEEEARQPPSPQREDIHEAAAFMLATNCRRLMLVYPQLRPLTANEPDVRQYRVTFGSSDAQVGSVVLDLASLPEQGVEPLAVKLYERII